MQDKTIAVFNASVMILLKSLIPGKKLGLYKHTWFILLNFYQINILFYCDKFS